MKKNVYVLSIALYGWTVLFPYKRIVQINVGETELQTKKAFRKYRERNSVWKSIKNRRTRLGGHVFK